MDNLNLKVYDYAPNWIHWSTERIHFTDIFYNVMPNFNSLNSQYICRKGHHYFPRCQLTNVWQELPSTLPRDICIEWLSLDFSINLLYPLPWWANFQYLSGETRLTQSFLLALAISVILPLSLIFVSYICFLCWYTDWVKNRYESRIIVYVCSNIGTQSEDSYPVNYVTPLIVFFSIDRSLRSCSIFVGFVVDRSQSRFSYFMVW